MDPTLFRRAREFHQELMPSCTVQPMYGDTLQLADEVANGFLDAALVQLPVDHPELHIEQLHREPLVVCLRNDDPLATKSLLRVVDLKSRAVVFHDPQRHPRAHARLLELLAEVGLSVEHFARGSNLAEMMELVREGYGFAFIREGMALDSELVARPIAGVDWTVDIAIAYHRERHPNTAPIIARKLRQPQGLLHQIEGRDTQLPSAGRNSLPPKRPPQSVGANAYVARPSRRKA
ncbi:LysR family transcriptional regulator substrate-binding protein [Bryocella elongata]|nr:LysR family transcriptional regulator substrate-binding protein [Bryocella elongata]